MNLSGSELKSSADEEERSGKIGRQVKFDFVSKEWGKLVNDDVNLNRDFVPQEVLDAWIRCRDRGLDPDEKPHPKIFPKEEFAVLCEKNKSLKTAELLARPQQLPQSTLMYQAGVALPSSIPMETF